MKIKQIEYTKILEYPRKDFKNFKLPKKIYNKPNEKDKKIFNEISIILKKNVKYLKNFSGEWEFVNKFKRSRYLNAIKKKNFSELINLFSNMFQNEVTYGVVTPSFLDIKNKKNYISQILNDIDACIEFSEINDFSPLLLNKQIGNPYGLEFKEKILMPDTPRHYYFAKKIKDLTKSKKVSLVEIGGGYGGMSKLIFQLINKCNYYSIDLFEGCLLQYYFLRKCNVNVKIVFDAEELEKNCVNLIPYSKDCIKIFKKINNVDLVFNSRSFSEMRKSIIKNYFDNINNYFKPNYILHENTNYLLFPKSKRHIEILGKNFPIGKKYKLLSLNISPFSGGNGRYREFLYKKI